MICFVDIEHQSWLENYQTRASHMSYCTDVKSKLEEITGRPCIVEHYADVTHQRLRELRATALVIGGNATGWHNYGDADLAVLRDIIRSAAWPILGLCGGHQLIAMAHGSRVAPMRRLRRGEPDVTTLSGPGYLKEWGFMPMDVVGADPVFEGLGASPVFLELHYCEVKELPAGFQRLASSRDCPIQVMRRLDKPVYGTQFHPEGYTEAPYDRRNALVNLVYPEGFPEARTDGRELLTNFFRIAGILSQEQ